MDSPDVAVPPGLWDMAVDPPPLFADCQVHLPVPHTYWVQVSSPWLLRGSHGTGRSAACAGVWLPQVWATLSPAVRSSKASWPDPAPTAARGPTEPPVWAQSLAVSWCSSCPRQSTQGCHAQFCILGICYMYLF